MTLITRFTGPECDGDDCDDMQHRPGCALYLTECEACLVEGAGGTDEQIDEAIDAYREEQGYLCDDHAPGYEEEDR
jgi:hypothetical protein